MPTQIPIEYTTIEPKIDTFREGKIQTDNTTKDSNVQNFDNKQQVLLDWSTMLDDLFQKTNTQLNNFKGGPRLNERLIKDKKEDEKGCGDLRELIQDICDIRIYFDDERYEVIDNAFKGIEDEIVNKIIAGEVLFNQNVIISLYVLFLFYQKGLARGPLKSLASQYGATDDGPELFFRSFIGALTHELFNVKDVALLELALDDTSQKMETDIHNLHQDVLNKFLDKMVDDLSFAEIFKGTDKKIDKIKEIVLKQDLCRTNKDYLDTGQNTTVEYKGIDDSHPDNAQDLRDYYMTALEEYIEQILFWTSPKWKIIDKQISLDDCSRYARALINLLPTSKDIIESNTEVIETSKITVKSIYESKQWVEEV